MGEPIRIETDLRFLDNMEIDISLSPVLSIIGIFAGLAAIFVAYQLRREYHWMRSLGGIGTLFDTADDI